MSQTSPLSCIPSEGPETGLLRIIGIGASAGGVEALRDFFSHLSPLCDFAFVVALHLDPDQKDFLVEILTKSTALKVQAIEDGGELEAGVVYVLPPNAKAELRQGKLHLSLPEESQGLRLPIDSLFFSLAEELQERSVGMIFSGMGRDGTMGLSAIQERGGKTFVQDPGDAKFQDMPRNAVEGRVGQVVKAAAELGEHLLALMGEPTPCPSFEIPLPYDAEELQSVLDCLRLRTGHDFSFYKKNTFSRRLDRRLEELRVDTLGDYVQYLATNEEEVERLFQELLIGVTGFFRDPEVWEKLKTTIFPELFESLEEGSTLRVWTPGCSTGQEAYSLAMIFQELKEEATGSFPYNLHVFATDLDKNAIEKARRGKFCSSISSEVSPERLKKHFTSESEGYRIRDHIRQMITFAPQNLISDPPFTRLDLLICRNLLIYLEPELQAKLIPLFHYSLKPGGILLLGSSESIGNSGELFTALEGKERFFRRLPKDSAVNLTDFPTFSLAGNQVRSRPGLAKKGSSPDLRWVTEHLLLSQSDSTAVLCDEAGTVLYIHGRSGDYLEFPQGKATMNIFNMSKVGLSGSLDIAFAKARRQSEAVFVRGLPLSPDNDERTVEIRVRAFSKESLAIVLGRDWELQWSDEMSSVPFVLVLFSQGLSTPTENLVTPSTTLRELGLELENALLELQLQRQEAQVTKEELQSNNEELQSLNEELMTSKEEMQSMNEELQTVNQELRVKMEELTQTSDDMKNLLNSTDIATLFLDEDMCIRRYTDRTATLINLKPGDKGRPITDLSSILSYPELTRDGAEVLESLLPVERQVVAQDGRSFKVSIMPYYTQDNRVDGLVLTFVDVAAAQPRQQAGSNE